jgi:dolichol-phosphate mannosyltransferase
MSSTANSALKRTLVFTATYNEAGNIEPLLNEIWLAVPETSVLVVDDNSPDGTGKILDQIASRNPKLIVIHRPGKMGVGSAHKLAITYAADNGFDALVTMDADFSHEPKVLPALFGGLKQNHFVIGSRFVEGGRLDYTGFRLFISHGANFLAHALLGVIPRETTTSFRAFSRELLKTIPVQQIEADGYSFFLECTDSISLMTKRILEVPIHFQDRRYGKSKISKREIYMGFLTVGRLALDRARRIFGLKAMPPVLQAN